MNHPIKDIEYGRHEIRNYIFHLIQTANNIFIFG